MRKDGFARRRGRGKENVGARIGRARPVILRFALAPESANVAAMSFTRCFSSLGCPELSLDETIGLAAKHDIAALELRALGGSVDLAEYFTARFGTPEKLAAKLRGSSTRIVALDASLRLVGGAASDREQLVALGPWAHGLGIPWLRVFDGGKNADPAELAVAATTVQWWREHRARHGWQTDLIVETHDSLFTAAAINRFTAAIPGVPVLWDSHHTWRKGGEDPVATWRQIRASVVHVHVKDSVARPSARHPYTYVLPGDGEFPITPLLTTLQADGYSGAVSLEWERMWHPYLPSLDEALATAAARRWW